MKKFLNALQICPLFKGISDNEILQIVSRLGCTSRHFSKGSTVFAVGDTPDRIGVVLAGSVNIVQDDYWGNRSILSMAEPGELFGEAFVCAGIESLPVSVIAREDSNLMFIGHSAVFKQTFNTAQGMLIKNLVEILGQKNIILTRKIRHVTQKTIREKVMSFLSERAVLSGKSTFKIPFNRQEMADYLSVDRSALSATLSRLCDEGVITFHKNVFSIK